MQQSLKKLAQTQRQIDIEKWNFASTDRPFKKASSAASLVSLELKSYLIGSFLVAVTGPNGPKNMPKSDRHRWKALCANLASSSVTGIVRKLLAVRATMGAWERARKLNDFSMVEDELQRLVDLRRKEAQKRAKYLGLASPYEAILDFQTPGLRLHHLEKWDQELSVFSRDLLKRVKASRSRVSSAGNKFPMGKEDQKKLEKYIYKKMGLRLKELTFSEAPHPMCLGSHNDVRIGMRYDEDNYVSLIHTAFHEGGHALYRQNLPAESKDNLSGFVAGAAMDEAMALIMEDCAGRDKNYICSLAGSLTKKFNQASFDPGAIYSACTELSARTVRTESDEVRYPLDVILRIRLEKALFDEGLPVKELPSRWNSEFFKLTGMHVKSDNEGVLQDIHWFGGEFGWFPNYLIGRLASAQIFEKACQDSPAISSSISNGNVAPLREWLNKNIYRTAASEEPLSIIRDVTGSDLSTRPYKVALTGKYLPPGSAFSGTTKKP
jgi:carboxypeptidase Taq